MDNLLDNAHGSLLAPDTLIGAVFWGVLLLLAATIVARMIRKVARRVEEHLSDTTGLQFSTALGQMMAYLVAFVLYAHLVPELRSLGTTLLAGVSIVSVVVGLAAQNTLGNLIAGFSLVLYRPIRVGDRLEMNSPKGLIMATVVDVSLGYTILKDSDGREVIVPNSIMISSIVIRHGNDN